MKYKSSSRSVSDLKCHLVLTTKYRRKAINEQMLKRITEITYDLASKWGVVVLEFNGESDHVHLLFEFYPQMQLSKFVNSLKTVTSRLIRKEFEDKLPYAHKRRHVFWNESYFIASCGGVTVDVLKKYVEQSW